MQRLSTSSLPNQCTSSHPQRYPLKLDDFASSKAQKMMRAASWITSNILTSYSGLHVFFSGGSTGRRPFQDLASGAVEGRRRAARRRQELQGSDQGVCNNPISLSSPVAVDDERFVMITTCREKVAPAASMAAPARGLRARIRRGPGRRTPRRSGGWRRTGRPRGRAG